MAVLFVECVEVVLIRAVLLQDELGRTVDHPGVLLKVASLVPLMLPPVVSHLR